MQQVRVERRVSYVEAVRAVQVQGNTGSRERWLGASRSGVTGQVGGDIVYGDKRKLVTFIAGAINSTAKVESKMERIQLIVKAVGRHLSMTGLTWEEV